MTKLYVVRNNKTGAFLVGPGWTSYEFPDAYKFAIKSNAQSGAKQLNEFDKVKASKMKNPVDLGTWEVIEESAI